MKKNSSSKAAKAQAMDELMDEQRKSVVQQLAEDMMSGKKDWMKPWRAGFAAHNPVTGNTYSGMNKLHLAYVARAKGYTDKTRFVRNTI